MGSRGSRWSRCLRAPLRVLGRARDFYVRSMTGCAGHMNYGAPMGYPALGSVPRSYSMNSTSDDDLRELIRAASQRRGGGGGGVAGHVQRSQSVAVGRIDEDAPLEFNDRDFKIGSDLLFPRSRSYAAGAVGGINGGKRRNIRAFV
ncbi:uncharacterized protein [Typha latifolia]|uniref:uncharacterized protein n=1 Tax=Typha latifolia TaxID=4733 RepID=UPI003C2F1D46